MNVRIVTDSTCDLPQSVIKDLGICVIPLYIRVGDRDYLDGIDMTRDDFYRNLPLFKDHPTTAAPSLQKFKAIYDSMAEEGASEVLSIHISTTLSATYSIAVTASEETTSVPVTVYDSRQLSLGTGFQVQKAAEMARDGKNVQEIIVELDKQVERIHVWALLDTLKYLRRSGRMNPVISTIGEILQIKPILKMFKGVSAAEKVRTRKKGLARLMEMLKDLSPFERIAFLHSDAIDEAKALQTAVRKLLPDNEIWLEIINPVLGAHIGTGVVGFVCITKE